MLAGSQRAADFMPDSMKEVVEEAKNRGLMSRCLSEGLLLTISSGNTAGLTIQ